MSMCVCVCVRVCVEKKSVCVCACMHMCVYACMCCGRVTSSLAGHSSVPRHLWVRPGHHQDAPQASLPHLRVPTEASFLLPALDSQVLSNTPRFPSLQT